MIKITPLKFSFLLFVFLGASFFLSCTAFNGEQSIPAYIHIDTILLHTNPETQGSKSSKITDAWIYVDDELIGAFEMPCTVPVLMSGKHKVRVLAGIKMNGIASTRIYYPFYSAYSADITLEEKQTDTVRPTVTYDPATVFVWTENFENGSSSLERTSRSDSTIQIVTTAPNVFEGSYSGAMYLGDTAKLFECSTIMNYSLPMNKAVFLELNYKTNNLLTVGIFGNSPSQVIQSSVMVLNHTSGWNKVYINLTPAVESITDATSFKVFFGMFRETGVTRPEAFIDNVKLVTY
ncbi:MAG: hypothetical protein WCO63_07290 [Bacteroidota bacterium]